ncbi:DNA polymerase III subunit alpha [Pseudomaricurvus alkylphenolicus]|jgi:DNA polymerase-3 subunit alpha|uniref:DNA polymerase III subunit alpha n=1 Tax=Pseudomaricurvus alkylphenolicus TaxID=1306991 RepID=UPI001423B34D|nr:DNA polymerase III subunit alpha [Pseudomaricurvus alkylphenolicus]NIB42011.1 DNA polymerase III subunit alpha [Pseudomaricurvus alkylphenolicus]
MTPNFVHLRLHSEFSLFDSLIRIKPLVGALESMGMPACGITDHCNFFGLVKFYKAAQGSGIKPIGGSDFWVRPEETDAAPYLVTLLAMNTRGYKNITELISLGYQQGQHQGMPYLKREWISQFSEGVIALSGAKFGDIGQALLSGKDAQAKALLRSWMEDFSGRFYIELQRTGRAQDEEYLHAAVALADQVQCPVVATNDCRFISADEFEVHEARVCIGEGRALDDPRRERRYSEQQYLRTPEEMFELFSDIPEALENTIEIAKRCTLDIELGNYYLPDYPIPDDFENDPYFKNRVPYDTFVGYAREAMSVKWSGREQEQEYAAMLRTNVFFQKISYEGLDERLEFLYDTSAPEFSETYKVYLERLQFELNIIMQMGFPGYFLIVMDFIQWAKDHDIPVGPGRGSGAGSLVAYVQKITDLDPLEYDLLFERFLNPERVSMPDFDVDFCMENRDQVISYVADNYGRDAVSQIITFGTMAAKAVVRDVARVQGKSYGLADKLSKMIPPDPGMKLQVAYEQEEILREFVEGDEEAQEIWEVALKLEGLTRNVGKHAGGVVIAPTKLTDFAPLYCDETGGGLVTQYDKGDVEDAGLVKFDFLGLRTLTIIDWAKKMIDVQRAKRGEEPLVIESIPLDDAKTFKLLKAAETTAVFQLESRGMKDLIKRLQPDNLEDMIALVALFRPGPLDSGMVDDFVNRKHGRAEVAYPDARYQHEKLEPILKPTYGVIVYQEQVMQIAQELAGYTLGGADMLRRAMGKKKPEEMAKQRSTFEEGAKSQGVNPELAMKIFDLVEKFAGYGFNKSHSAAYAVVSYQTAWLKAHYPAHFMAATMSSDMDKTDKVVTFIEECREMGLTLLPPDVNQGEFHFNVDDNDGIIYGLGAIKGLGEGPIENILEARKDGPFADLFDFCARIDPRRVNKRALEAMIRSGALDSLGPKVDRDYDRAVMFAAMAEAVKAAEQSAANASAGMSDLFGEVVPSSDSGGDVYSEFRKVRSWSIKERLNGEKETLGLYLTGHPIEEYRHELKHLISSRINDLKPEKSTQNVAGLVVGLRVMKTKRGDNMAFVTLDDRSGRIECAVFSDTYNEYREKLVKDGMLVIEGQVSYDDYSGGLKMRAEKIRSLADARVELARGLVIQVQSESVAQDFPRRLASMLEPYCEGRCAVKVDVQRQGARGQVMLGKEWRVSPRDELLEQLRDICGRDQVSLEY